MIISRVVHKINGNTYGMFYHFDDGRALYLAWRTGVKSRSIFFNKNAWCLDTATIREAEARGCKAIGIAHKMGKSVTYYITNLEDFIGPPSEVHPEGVTPQRRLARDKFPVNTAMKAAHIAKTMKI